MSGIKNVWARLEEWLIAFLLAAMTLITFIYVVLNNLYPVFYFLGERFSESSVEMSDFFYAIGDFFITPAQEMTWSNALVKMLFGWLIFIGISYGVRTAGHIGVDALVKLANKPMQRVIGVVATLCCLGYAGLMAVSSFEWIHTLYQHPTEAEDLGRFGIEQWHVGVIVPVGFFLVAVRFLEVLIRILTGKQSGLGLADEAKDALKLAEEQE
ncbi:TRAP transporter small permease [Pokkaliibacter sp. CJK22405]|uniref:TRAP transporter small permease n=1 Tax=Pokkaliibacter sp. CJK22405 TaxID=3384615 RepID=UPI0039850B6B